ncbi:MAG: CDP-alcohol phosphatidyltransferase family protein [Prolixibacteraceae bacterium]
MNFTKFNIAEFFAFIRILTFPVILLFILLEWRMITAWSYIILWSTDVLDGFFAHLFKKETIKRVNLDSYGDISFLVVGLIGMYVFERNFVLNHLEWIIAVVAGYVLQLIVSLLKFKQKTNFHTVLAKIAAVFQVVFISWTFFFRPLEWLFYLTVLISMLEVIEEIAITLIIKKLKFDIFGIWHWNKIKK